jgi:hypothetical protein
MPGKSRVQIGFEPAIVLHSVGQGIADNADMIALLEFKFGLLGLGWQRTQQGK